MSVERCDNIIHRAKRKATILCNRWCECVFVFCFCLSVLHPAISFLCIKRTKAHHWNCIRFPIDAINVTSFEKFRFDWIFRMHCANVVQFFFAGSLVSLPLVFLRWTTLSSNYILFDENGYGSFLCIFFYKNGVR